VKQQRNFIFGSVHFFITNTKGFLDLNHLPSAQQKKKIKITNSCALLSAVKIICKTTEDWPAP